MADITGTQAVVTIAGEALDAGPWSIGVDNPETHYAQKIPRTTPSFSGNISALELDSRAVELFPIVSLSDFLIKPGRAWFFPEFRGIGEIVDIDDSDDSELGFTVELATWDMSFKNCLAPIVYWLWRYPWYPVRWLRRQLWRKRKAA